MESVPVLFQDVVFGYTEEKIFNKLNLKIPVGMTSLLGPNGSGKSTLLYLATGRILPESGSVHLWGKPTSELEVPVRDLLASMLYQNLEFDQEESIGELLEMVEAAGNLTGRGLIPTIIRELELETLLDRPTSKVSKGEMQRALLGFSLLYGSSVMALDEPVFALEEDHKLRVMAFVREFSKAHGLSVLSSLHELELSRDYFDYMLFLPAKEGPELGTTAEMFSREKLEKLFSAPFSSLKTRESFFRLGLGV